VLWEITKGSLLNKGIILPIAFLLSAYAPWAITAILILGGLYLAYEGAEKIYEFIFHRDHKEVKGEFEDLDNETILAMEKDKIRSAIVTDFILSIEIVIIALGTVMQESLTVQVGVVTLIALVATVGVYGIVAMIVRMDDLGYRFINFNAETNSFTDKVGRVFVNALPWVIKSLSVIGTIALLLVSGGIFVHNIEKIHHLVHGLPSLLGEFLTGLVVGILVLVVVSLVKKLFKKGH
jgi:predicted DNA repair protein MutK